MARFGSFTFSFLERPRRGTWNGWQRRIHYAENQPVGGDRVDTVLMAVDSRRITFENVLTQTRFDEAELLQGTVAQFEDWDEPTPNFSNALLHSLAIRSWILDSWDPTERKLLVRWTLIEQ